MNSRVLADLQDYIRMDNCEDAAVLIVAWLVETVEESSPDLDAYGFVYDLSQAMVEESS